MKINKQNMYTEYTNNKTTISNMDRLENYVPFTNMYW